MFKQLEYSEVLLKNPPRKFNRCMRTMKIQLIITFYNLSDAQQVVHSSRYFQKHSSYRGNQ